MKKILFLVSLLLFLNIHVAEASLVTPININTADVKQLMTLKGIGVKKAQAIVFSRKQQGGFHSVNDLTRVKGLGQHFLQRLIQLNKGRIILNTKGTK